MIGNTKSWNQHHGSIVAKLNGFDVIEGISKKSDKVAELVGIAVYKRDC